MYPKQALLVSVTFLSSLVQAIPVPLEPRAISAGLLAQLSLGEQYAAAAYCPNNNIPASSTAITCSAGNCPLVQSAGATTLAEFENVGVADATGYVGIDHTNNNIVISFRGSKSIQNWIGNLDVVQKPWSLCSGCYVHSGFFDSWNSIKSVVVAALKTGIQQCPSCSIITTGHSLGGALSTIAAADLRSQGYAVTMYTYGSPMVANAALANFITAQPGAIYRVTHLNDPVPKLPGYLLGYAHVGTEYWITSGDNVAVGTGDIKVSSGIYDVAGNGGTVNSNVNDHLWYFNGVASCSS